MEIESSELTDESGPENVENWDSYNGLLLVDEIESEFNVKFTIEEISEPNSDLSLISFLKNSLVDNWNKSNFSTINLE